MVDLRQNTGVSKYTLIFFAFNLFVSSIPSQTKKDDSILNLYDNPILRNHF